jgi:hypothetical protein
MFASWRSPLWGPQPGDASPIPRGGRSSTYSDSCLADTASRWNRRARGTHDPGNRHWSWTNRPRGAGTEAMGCPRSPAAFRRTRRGATPHARPVPPVQEVCHLVAKVAIAWVRVNAGHPREGQGVRHVGENTAQPWFARHPRMQYPAWLDCDTRWRLDMQRIVVAPRRRGGAMRLGIGI